jgi:hypothetical protein
MPRRNIVVLTALFAFAVLVVFLVVRGPSARAEQDNQSQARTATEHAAVCGRLGSAVGSSQHTGCVRELDALKTMHDKWSAEAYASII